MLNSAFLAKQILLYQKNIILQASLIYLIYFHTIHTIFSTQVLVPIYTQTQQSFYRLFITKRATIQTQQEVNAVTHCEKFSQRSVYWFVRAGVRIL